MNYSLEELFSYSVAIGAIIGLVRIKKMNKAFFPFIILLWAGLLNEITSTVSINIWRTNAINSNIYSLAEALIILWLFKNLGLFEKHKEWFYFLVLLFITTWITDNLIISKLTRFNSYFRILYSFITVLMSIHLINRIILEKNSLIKNPVFLIMIGFIAFFAYEALVEIFWVYGLNESKNFRVMVFRIMTFINLAVNLIYALAVLWIPGKREYTLL